MNWKKKITAFISATVLSCTSVVLLSSQYDHTVTASEANTYTYDDIPSEYIAACDWVWDNRIYDNENEDWMKDYATVYDQLIAGKGTINYIIRWDSYQTITLAQRKQLQVVLEDAINKWNDCLVGYENWPIDHVTVNIVGWCVLDSGSLEDIQPNETVYTGTMNSTMRDYIIESNMAADASSIPTLEPTEPTDLSRYVHWSDKGWNYNGSYENRYDMFLEGINGMIDQGGFGWHYGQYLSSNSILGLINGTASQHILLHEMGHSFGFPDYYGGIGESDGIPPGDFPDGEGSVMEAGRAMYITPFDTWFARYAWSKLSAQNGRFDLSNFNTEITTTTTTSTETTTTTTTTTTSTETTTTTTTTTKPINYETYSFSGEISSITLNNDGTSTIGFGYDTWLTFSGSDYYGGDESKNLLHYEAGDEISITLIYDPQTNEIISISSLELVHNSHRVMGDVNKDGVFNITDVVKLQKWLLQSPGITLEDYEAADLCEDGKIDVFDLCLMKRKLIDG